MPTSVKSSRDSTKESLKSDRGKTGGPLVSKSLPNEYTPANRETSIEKDSIIDTIGSFSDSESIKTGDNTESENTIFSFKRLNNRGSLRQIKGEKGDGEVKSKKSIFSRFSLRRKAKKEEKEAKKKSKGISASTVKPSSDEQPTAINTGGLENDKSTAVEDKNKEDEVKSVFSLKKSTKSKISSEKKEKKEIDDEKKSVKSLTKSILSRKKKEKSDNENKENNEENPSTKSTISKFKEVKPETTAKAKDEDNKSIKSATNSKLRKTEEKKSDKTVKDKNEEDKSIISSTKSTLSKIKEEKSDTTTKAKDEDNKSIKPSTNSKQDKSETVGKDNYGENKSIASSTRSTLLKSKQEKSDNENKNDTLIQKKEDIEGKQDSYSFKKINADGTLTSKSFNPIPKQDLIIEESLPVDSVKNDALNNADNAELKSEEIDEKEAKISFPPTIKPITRVDQDGEFEPKKLRSNAEQKHEILGKDHAESVEIKNQTEINQPSIDTPNNHVDSKNILYNHLEQAPFQISEIPFGFPKIIDQQQYLPPFNTCLTLYPLVWDNLILVNSDQNSTPCLNIISFY